MTAQDVENGEKALAEADNRYYNGDDPAGFTWNGLDEDERAYYRALFLAALSFIRERADKRFDFEYGSLTSVRNLDSFLSPPSESGP